ncbi:MAG: HAD family phosphatase [Thermoleophilia bacterium]|nr:HAD family phosphatase [Thermoleophilia bacterium]MDQ3858926.1 HAD family phosphatase [Actinomycetota bacterium]
MRAGAVMIDFNGTLSDDELVLAEIFSQLFCEYGKPLTADEYFGRLAGLSDPEIVRTWLGRDHPDVEKVVGERIARYRAAVAGGSTVPPEAREAVRYAAARIPVALVTGAARIEVEPVLEAAGIADAFSVLVSADDVGRGKPHPEGYERALALLDGDLAPDRVVVFEDTEAGVAAAKAAGMRCVALLGTLAPERLAAADELAERLDVELVKRFVGE